MKRRHDIDSLRVLAFGLLIVYHIGMFYVADWGWHIKSNYLSEPLQLLMQMVNPWRMSLIFLISGVALSFVLTTQPAGVTARRRLRQLAVPLLFGMAVVVPPQAYIEAVTNNAFSGSYLAFLIHYFSFSGWPEGAFAGSDIGITWMHLWYLPYLLLYTLIVCAGINRAPVKRLLDWMGGLTGFRLLLIPIALQILFAWTLREHFPQTHSLLDDWYMHAVYFTIFLFGFAFGQQRRVWDELVKMRWVSLRLGVIAWTSLMIAFEWWPESATLMDRNIIRILIVANVWFWLVTILGFGHRHLNRPFSWLPRANMAIYPWYVLHQTVIIVLAYWLTDRALGPVVEPLILAIGTVACCYFLEAGLIRRFSWLGPLFGARVPVVARGQQKMVDRAGEVSV